MISPKRSHASIQIADGNHPVIAAFPADAAARLALTVLSNAPVHTPLAVGHVVRQVDTGALWVLKALPPSSAANWGEWVLDAPTKAYVDAIIQGFDLKGDVKTAALTNIALTGLQTVAGVALQAGDRCLALGQSSGAENGPYVVSAGAWTRTPETDSSADLSPGAYVLVTAGTLKGSGWLLTTPAPITLGTTALSWERFGTDAADITVTAVKTAGYAAAAGELVLVDTTGGAISVTLPTAVGNDNRQLGVKRVAGSSAVTFATTSGETIDGGAAALYSIPGYVPIIGATLWFISDGANWRITDVYRTGDVIGSVIYTAAAVTLQLSDAGLDVGMSSATTQTLTVPPGTFPVGQVLQGTQLGDGKTQFVAGSGVTILTSLSLYTRIKGSPWTLYQRMLNAWELVGDLA